MTFLQKLGTILAKTLQIVIGFAPAIQAAIPQASGPLAVLQDKLQRIADLVVQAEAIGQALGIAGPDKLKGITPLIAQEILSSSLLVGHVITNQALFLQGAASIGSGVADVLNSLQADAIQTENKAA